MRIVSGKQWREIADESQQLLTRALEKLAAAEHERDRALQQRDQAQARAERLAGALEEARLWARQLFADLRAILVVHPPGVTASVGRLSAALGLAATQEGESE